MATDGATLLSSPGDELTRLREENERLRASWRQSTQDNELLQASRDQLLEAQRQKDRTIEQLQAQLQSLLRRLYGRSAEKIDKNQLQLFETLLNQLAPSAPNATAADEASPGASGPSPRRNGHGRRKLPSDLPRQKIVHDLPEDQKPCPCCGKMRHVIGQEVSEQLDFIPAKLTVLEHVRLTYACRHCEQEVAEGGSQVITADKPSSPIEKGLAAPGLLSYVIVSKYGDHLPLHRLEHILARHGIEIARSTMCDWAAQCAGVLRPLHDLMTQRVLQSKVIHTDDTPVKVLDRDRTQTRTGRFWAYLGDQDHPQTVFTYTASRSRDGPREFLKGWSGYLQADAFGGYDGIYAGEVGGRVTEVACWAHARRKFYDARTSDAAASTQALAYIRLLYDLENQARERFESLEQAAPDEENGETPGSLSAIRLALRRERAVPRLEQFHSWLRSQQAARGGPVLPKSPMGEAITYALNQWDALCVYTADGDLNIDNNAAENALRRVAIGRKNWLFCGSDTGGRTAAVLFSLIATCQRHKVEPLAYLRDTLTRIAATPMSQLDQFLPDRWQLAQDAKQSAASRQTTSTTA
jgi:transposase